MNDDLLISIGADLSSFNSAIDQAKSLFKSLEKTVGSGDNRKKNVKIFGDFAKDFAMQMDAVEKKTARTALSIKKKIASGLSGFGTNPEKWSKAQKQTLDRYYNEYVKTVKSIEQVQTAKETRLAAKTIKIRKATQLELYRLGVKFSQDMSNAQLKRLLRQKKQEIEIARQTANSVRAIKTRATTPAVGGRQSITDSAINRSILDSVAVVARYGAISQVLYGIQTAFRDVIVESARFDNSIKKSAAVLGKSQEEGLGLAKQIVKVGKSFGQSFEEIEEGLLTIGRAGLDDIEPLKNATEGLAALSLITGDAIRDGAAAVASLISVYPELTNETVTYTDAQGNLISGTEDLINKMGAVANATRLGLKDFSTISNYALTTAKSVGLSSDAYLSLAGSLSKVGLNASTIGTSIRRLNKFAQDSSDAVQRFFSVVGKTQKNFAKGLKDDVNTPLDESAKALGEFTKRLSEMSDEQFSNAIKDLNIQMKATAVSLREVGKINAFANMMYEVESARSILKQGEDAAKGLSTRWQIAMNTLVSSMDLVSASVIKQIEEVLNKAEKDGVNAFEIFGEAIQAFGGYAIKILADVALALSGIVSLIAVSVGGFAKLFGIANQTAADWRTYSKEELAEQKKAVDEAQKLHDDRTKRSTITLRNLRAEKREYEEMLKINKSADALRQRGTDQRKFGDDLIDKTAKAQTEINNLQAGVYKGVEDFNKSMDDIKKKSEEMKKDLPEYDTSSFVEGGLPIELTPEQIAIREKMVLSQRLLNKEISEEQARREEIAIDVNELATKYSLLQALADDDLQSSKKSLDADRAKKALFDKLIEQKIALQKQNEKGGGSERATITALIKEAELRGVILETNAYMTGHLLTQNEQDQIALDIAKEKTVAMAEAYQEALKEATTAKGMMALKQAELKLFKAIRNEAKIANKDALKFAKSMKKAGESFADSLLSGDIKGAFKGLFKEITKVFTDPLKESFSTLFGNKMKDMVGSFYDSLTGFMDNWAKYGFDVAMKVASGNATAAVANQASSGDPYTAWARMAAMAATMAGLGILIGSVGGGGGGAKAPELETYHAESESLSNALDNIYDVEYAMLTLTRDMRGYLSIIANSFGNIENSLLRSDIDFAGNFFEESIKSGSFGLSTKEYTLAGTTLEFEAATIGELLGEELDVVRDTIIKKVYDSFWKTKTTYFHNYEQVGELFASDIADATQAMYDIFDMASEQLGIDITGLTDQVVDIGKIDTTGKSSAEIAEEIEARFYADIDRITDMYFEPLRAYQLAGEGMAETVVRVVTNMEQVIHALDRVGKAFGVSDVIYQFTEAMIAGAGGIDSLTAGLDAYLESFFTEQEQYEAMVKTMTTSFRSLGLTLPSTNADFRELAESININTEEGAYLYGELMTLAEGFAEMTAAADDLANSVDEIDISSITALADAWLGELSYLTNAQKTAYADSYYDIIKDLQAVNEEVSAVDAARSAAEAALRTSVTKEDYIPYFERYANALEDEVPEETLGDVVFKLDEVLIAIRTMDDNNIRSISDVRIVE